MGVRFAPSERDGNRSEVGAGSQGDAEGFGVAVAAAAAWRYEGRGIDEAGIAFDQASQPLPVVVELEAELQVVIETATAALQEVQKIKAQLV